MSKQSIDIDTYIYIGQTKTQSLTGVIDVHTLCHGCVMRHPTWENNTISLCVWNLSCSKVTQSSNHLPSGKHTKNYGKSPFLMGKSTINGHFQ